MQLFLLVFIVLLCHVAMVTAVAGCHSDRDKDHRSRVNCTAAGFSEVPVGVEPTTKVLLFPSNLFSSLSWSSFRVFDDLYEIDLTGNKVPEVTPSGAPILPTLSVLRLGSNRLTSLSDGSFSACPALTELYLDQNHIVSLSDHTFSGLGKLEILDLSSNGIKVLPELMLHPLPAIETLYLEINKIRVMPDNWFSSKEEVPYLYLSANPWACSCSLKYFNRYLKEYEDNVYVRDGPIIKGDVESVVCDSPERLRGKPVMHLEESDLCPNEEDEGRLVTESPYKITAAAATTTATTVVPFQPRNHRLDGPSIRSHVPVTNPSVVTESSAYMTTATPTNTRTSRSGPSTVTSTTRAPQVVSTPSTTPTTQVVSTPSTTPVPQVVSTPSTTPTTQVVSTPSTTPVPQVVSTPSTTPTTQVVSTPSTTPVPQVVLTPSTTPVPQVVSTPSMTPTTQVVSTPSTTRAPQVVSTPSTTRAPQVVSPPSTTPAPQVVSTCATAMATTRPDPSWVLDEAEARGTTGASGAAGVFCFWLFAACGLLCVGSAACILATGAKLVVWYRTVYKPLRAALARRGGGEGVRLLTYSREGRGEVAGAGGVTTLYRSVLFIHREEGGDMEREDGVTEGEGGGRGGGGGGKDRPLVTLAPTGSGEKAGKGGGAEEKGVYRKTLYRLLSKEEAITGWRDVMEQCRVSAEHEAVREAGGGGGGGGGGGVSEKRYSVILREERGEAGGGREEVEWVVGGWEIKGGGGRVEETRSSWGEWLEHYLPSMPWGVTLPSPKGEVPH